MKPKTEEIIPELSELQKAEKLIRDSQQALINEGVELFKKLQTDLDAKGLTIIPQIQVIGSNAQTDLRIAIK